METRSIFSNNTFKTTLNSMQGSQNTHHHFHHQKNALHSYLEQIIAPYTYRQYPFLTKIIYLHLLLKQNVLIFTQDRIAVREIVSEINSNLSQKEGKHKNKSIIIVDENTDVQVLLNEKAEKETVYLFYDPSKLNNKSVNVLINNIAQNQSYLDDRKNQFNFIGVQSSKDIPSKHITDLFSIIINHSEQEPLAQFMEQTQAKLNSFQAKTQTKFSKPIFDEWLKQNYETVIIQVQEEGFLKPFLRYFQSLMKNMDDKIHIPHSRWKKALKLLKFIGVNRTEGVYKRMGLTQMLLLPQTLATGLQELHLLKQLTKKAMMEFIGLYGRQKFLKSLHSHYWLENRLKKEMAEIVQSDRLRNTISFFYPCTKFPDTAFIDLFQRNVSEGKWELCYKVIGNQKKLMSDHHYPISQALLPKNNKFYHNMVQQTKNYLLSAEVYTEQQIKVHFGINCYDAQKNQILPIQVCRVEGSQVKFNRIQQNWLYIENIEESAGLKNWNSPENFHYLKGIGVYRLDHEEQYLRLENILFNKNDPLSKDKTTAATYTEIDFEGGRILLTEEAREWFINVIQSNGPQVILMNHFQGGNFCIASTIEFKKDGQNKEMQGQEAGNTITKATSKWHTLQFQYRGIRYENSGVNLLPGTEFIRITIMCISEFSKAEKGVQGQFSFREIKWKQQ